METAPNMPDSMDRDHAINELENMARDLRCRVDADLVRLAAIHEVLAHLASTAARPQPAPLPAAA